MKTLVAAPSAVKEVKIMLDGKETLVPAGITILKAARRNGIRIPTMCWLGKVKPIGACRVCSVEVEGVASPVMSCTTPVVEGMNIKTQGEKLEEYRRDMIRFILVRHPLDCPICERSGECKLQDLTYEFGIKGHAWKIEDYEKIPVKDWGLIRYDKNLCILCERCIKICREVQGRGDFEIDGNGFNSCINTVTGKKLDCDFCGQCISVCPVGALSSGMIFSARSWEMEKKKSVCPHCGVGCTLYLNVKKGRRANEGDRIVRVTSGHRTGHNKGNMCIRGRFGYEFIQSGSRITKPFIRQGENHVATDWNSALSLIAQKFSEIKSQKSGEVFAGIASGRATNEDSYVFQKFFSETLGGGIVESMANMLSPLTASGLFENFGDFPMTCSFDELKSRKLFIFIGAEGSVENPVVSNHVRGAMMANGAEVATIGSMEADFLPSPRLRLSYEYAEMHRFLLALLGKTVESINREGAFENGATLSDEWSAKLENETSEKVDESLKITELVRLIRKQSAPLYIIGGEAQKHPQAGAILQNIVNMAKLTGGKVALLREQCNTQGVIDMGFCEHEKEAADKGDLLNMMENGEIEALVIMEEDPISRHPDTLRFKKAIRRVKFVVVADQFHSRSCLEADVILPTCATAEKSGSFTNMEGRVQSFGQALAKPLGDSRAPWEIFADLAGRMGGDYTYKNSEEIATRISDELPMYGKVFSEPDGGLADYSALLTGKPALRWTRAAPMKSFKKNSTFVLLPYMQLSGGVLAEHCPTMTRLYGKPCAGDSFGAKPLVRFNRQDAERLALSEGDTVSFKNDSAEWKGKVEISSKIKAGYIGIPDYMDSYPAIKLLTGGKETDCVNSEWLKGEKC